jgi:hypothetical protein
MPGGGDRLRPLGIMRALHEQVKSQLQEPTVFDVFGSCKRHVSNACLGGGGGGGDLLRSLLGLCRSPLEQVQSDRQRVLSVPASCVC